MQNYTLMIVWNDGQVTQTGFATRQLAMAALDDIKVTGDDLRPDGVLDTLIRGALILTNAEPESPRKGK